MARPILGEIELSLTQKIEIEDDHVLVQHGIPALEGDFLQRLGRRASRIKLNGVMTGTEAAENLKTLRTKFREGAPVSFVADIATATQVDQVLIEEFGVRELAGKAERFAYELTLREMIAPPAQQTEAPPPEPPPPPPPTIGQLEVEVIVEGQPDFDFSKVEVTVEGVAESNGAQGATGGQFRRTLTNRTGNFWTDDQMPPGQFTASAVVNDPSPMSGSASVTVRRGELAHATITLRPGAVIAKAFIVHFHFDRSFIEPCMREVLQQVAAYAQAHPKEKLAIIGHADKAGHAIVAGPTDYNQSLSERRARAVYAYLTKDRDRGPAIADWGTLRLKQAGELPTLKDNWSKEGEAREYQYILMDLGFYSGNITEQHDAATDAAVRAFQRDKGLTDDGIVGDATWAALIDAYLSQDTVAVPESQFFPNARDACDSGKFKWMGASDRDPAKPDAPQNGGAWRPNRRTEMLFIAAESIPCEVPQPVTFNKPTPGAVGTGWCLGPGNFDRKPCFITRDPNEAGPEKWLVQPAEPGEVIVRGKITFEDGSPAAGVKYVLIAPDGEFMDGEIPSGTNHGRPIKGITDANGEFSYPDKPKGVGVYTMEVELPPGPHAAFADGEPPASARGSVVCKKLGTNDSVFNVKIHRGPASDLTVNPQITLASAVVVVKKSYTNPARQTVTLRTDAQFVGTGMFTRSSNAIRFFDAAVAGAEITFNGTDNVFDGARLTAGLQLFAEGATASAALDDVQLTLTLSSPGLLIGPPATATMTSVELTLDVAVSRVTADVDPAPLSTNDKINLGRSVQVQNPGFDHERAMLIIQPPNPAAFAGTLVLTPINAQVQAFVDEVPAAGQTPVTPIPFPVPVPIPPGGTRLFVDGTSASNAVRDTGFQLGIQNVEPDGDRVLMTAVQFDLTLTASGAVAASPFVRFGLWDQAFDPATGNLRNGAADADHFIGADSRRFFFRLRDHHAVGIPQIEWRTVKADGTADHAPAGQPLQLLETAPNSHLFFSRPVFMVTDDIDQQLTGSGLPVADVGLLTPRIRKVTVDATHPLDGKLAATYTPAAGQILRNAAVLFSRSPEERRRLRVHLVNVRASVGGTGVLTLARKNRATNLFHSLYGVCGIFVEVDEILIDPPASCLAWPTVYPGNAAFLAGPNVEGFAFQAGNLVASASQSDIVAVVRNLATFNADDIYIVFINRILSAPLPSPPVIVPPAPAPAVAFLTGGGESFPDSFTANNSTARGFTFVSVLSGSNNVEVHETTHVTTDLRNAAGGHYDLGLPPTAVPTPTAPGNIDGKNLMHRFGPLITSSVTDPKRLWNTQVNNANYNPALVLPPQIDAIRRSRFVHNF